MTAPTGQDKRAFAEWNEEMVERYDIDRYYREARGIVRWIEDKRLAALQRLADAHPRDRVLEVGCGGGHVLEHFVQGRRFGVDLSENMLERAAKRLRGGANLMRASADALPFKAGSFDVVLCTEVLEHVPDPAAVIRELLRVSAPGARVVVSIPNEHNIDLAKRVLRRTPVLSRLLRHLASEGNEWHLHHFDWQMLEHNVRGIGRIRERVAIPNRIMPIRYVATLEAMR